MFHCIKHLGKKNSFKLLELNQLICIRSQTKYNKPYAAIEPQVCVPLTTNRIISPPLSQTSAEFEESATVLRPAVDVETFQQISSLDNGKEMKRECVPVPFEDIPGPGILKLWEKYWKYVPVLGTQLFCSLMMNSIIEGGLLWNRNITPMKYLFNKYGPIVRINAPMMADVVMIHRPEHITQVFQQDGKQSMRSAIDILQHYRSKHRKLKAQGPFTKQGQEWTETRVALDKSISQHVPQCFNKFNSTCDELILRIRDLRNRQDEVPETFSKDLLRWGMECFFLLVFNKKIGFLDSVGLSPTSDESKLIDALFIAHHYMSRCETGFQVWRFIDTYYSKKLFNACDTIDSIIEKNIRHVQSKLEFQSLSDVDNSSPILENLLIDKQMHPDDVSILLMDLIILGVQAVCNTQAFLLYFLAKHPRIQHKLHDEVCRLFTNGKSTLSETKIKQTPYLDACLHECLRLRPAFPYISRLLTENITLRGYIIPKGTYLMMANEISSRREENFEDPEKFIPERWLNEKLDGNYMAQERYWSCLPFGHGARSCIGRMISEMQIKLLTTKVVREFRIEYEYGDIESRFLMMNVPKKPLRFRFVDRN